MRVLTVFVAILCGHVLCLSIVSAKKKDERPSVKAKEGDTINLTCDRGSVTAESLYAVKWYKDEKEFFRNYPKAENPVKVFPIDGFELELPVPTPWQVVLKNVNASASGKYTCMVVDYPRYRTIYKSTLVEIASKNDTLHQSHPPDYPRNLRKGSSAPAVSESSIIILISAFFIASFTAGRL
ncbi:hypothetical protein Ocin01_03738 [Orchesella cincta]|uniref:Ig-like domain-containing protein n=1 Tax=Orchesella cincta TaxID=48709 RepID=A0A1D2NCD8_ORCCI|nr:hypothetical protein Ocin01_03738 [Orchesella cincta]